MRVLDELIHRVRCLFYPPFDAGRKAELLFEQLAQQDGWIVQKIAQDREGFAQYAASSPGGIKRGDFLVRNLRNAEIEVKCFSVSRRREPGYQLHYSHVKRHEGMQNVSESPVVFAIFERLGRNPVPGSLRMIPLSELTRGRSREITYDERSKTLHIPLRRMYPGFEFLRRLAAHAPERDRSWRR